jgi:hypothetical protein
MTKNHATSLLIMLLVSNSALAMEETAQSELRKRAAIQRVLSPVICPAPPSSPVMTFVRAASPLIRATSPDPVPLQVSVKYKELLESFRKLKQNTDKNSVLLGFLMDLQEEARRLVQEAQALQYNEHNVQISNLHLRIHRYINELFPPSPTQQRARGRVTFADNIDVIS